MDTTTPRPSSLRWQILRQALRSRESAPADEQFQRSIDSVSRKAKHGFDLIPCQIVNRVDGLAVEDQKSFAISKRTECSVSRDVCLCYTLPVETAPKLFIYQRVERANITDFEICNKHDVDNTGLVCQWPSEDVLAYYCMLHADFFRCKRVIEIGSGYGLAGLVIAAVTEASEVVISDGNPQVVDYIQRSIAANAGAFSATSVKAMVLHWNQEKISICSDTFDIIVASDCTFFKEFHRGLVRTVSSLLKSSGTSEAIFVSPRRGDSLDKFLTEIKDNGLQFSLSENYDTDVWRRHQAFMNGDESWPNYDEDHCYPLLVRIMR